MSDDKATDEALLTEYREGDWFTYVSVTQGYEVMWTRDAEGLWHASDEAATGRGVATDDEVRTCGQEVLPGE